MPVAVRATPALPHHPSACPPDICPPNIWPPNIWPPSTRPPTPWLPAARLHNPAVRPKPHGVALPRYNRPTPERLRQGDLSLRASSDVVGMVVYENRQPLLLDTMAISDGQRQAGLLLREMYIAAGMMPHETHDIESWSLSTGEMADFTALMRRAVTETLRAVPLECRCPLSDLCFRDVPANPKALLRGLTHLARYFDRETRQRGTLIARFAREVSYD